MIKQVSFFIQIHAKAEVSNLFDVQDQNKKFFFSHATCIPYYILNKNEVLTNFICLNLQLLKMH